MPDMPETRVIELLASAPATRVIDLLADCARKLADEHEAVGSAARAGRLRAFATRGCEIVRELEAERDRLTAAVLRIVAVINEHVMRGERVTYTTASEPIGVRGGQITTRIGDLCDVRNAVEQIARPWLYGGAITSAPPEPTEGDDA